MKYQILKECLLFWIEESEHPTKCKIKPGETSQDLKSLIEGFIYRIEQVEPSERHRKRISINAKNSLERIYEAIQNPENFNVEEKEKSCFPKINLKDVV